jgi:Flp pilus assembly protein TadG
MKKFKHKTQQRDPNSGAVAIIIAIFLTTLFGFAAFAVDMGFRYTKSRMLQSVADSAVSAGMSALVAGNAATAGNTAANMATANGYPTSYPGPNITAAGGQLSVKVTTSAPSFFASIFGGGNTRLLSATAVGVVTATPGPALMTLGNCGSSGLSESGNGAFQINGPVESSGPLTFSTGGSAVQNFGSTVSSACAGTPSMGSGPITYSAGPATGGGGPYTNPFSAITLASLEPYCTHGHTTVAQDLQFGDWTGPGPNSIWTLNPGVYCSSGPMTLSGPGTAFIATGVTIISAGAVTIGANNTLAGSSVWTAAAGIPGGLAVYSDANTVNCAGQAINLGSMNLVVNGSVYAPNGCANLSGDDGMTINGSVISENMMIGASGDWTFNPNGSVAGNNWRMLR